MSDQALGSIGTEIESNYGKEYLHIRKYKSKSANAQEAHEAIRPTFIEKKNANEKINNSNSDNHHINNKTRSSGN